MVNEDDKEWADSPIGLPAIQSWLGASLTAAYDNACRVIDDCESIPQVLEMTRQADAIGHYARAARDFDAEHATKRIRLKAVRKLGELLLRIPVDVGGRPAKGNDKTSVGAHGGSERVRVAREHGIPPNQERDCISIAKLLPAVFEEALARNPPPSVTALAKPRTEWNARRRHANNVCANLLAITQERDTYLLTAKDIAEAIVEGKQTDAENYDAALILCAEVTAKVELFRRLPSIERLRELLTTPHMVLVKGMDLEAWLDAILEVAAWFDGARQVFNDDGAFKDWIIEKKLAEIGSDRPWVLGPLGYKGIQVMLHIAREPEVSRVMLPKGIQNHNRQLDKIYEDYIWPEVQRRKEDEAPRVPKEAAHAAGE